MAENRVDKDINFREIRVGQVPYLSAVPRRAYLASAGSSFYSSRGLLLLIVYFIQCVSLDVSSLEIRGVPSAIMLVYFSLSTFQHP